MKKIFAVLLTLMFLFTLSACSQKGDTKSVTVTIGKSDSFTEKEIKGAVDAVKTKFKKNYGGCTLISVTYNETESREGAEGYIRSGGGKEKGVKAEDVIYLVSDFKTGEKIEATGFETNTEYNGWTWTVVRGSNGKWCVVDSGYC
ncbi:MAG: hypothetical protein ACI4XE_08065 [Acutalibacteraceae bacterium]